MKKKSKKLKKMKKIKFLKKNDAVILLKNENLIF
jgi:hypothetical protein